MSEKGYYLHWAYINEHEFCFIPEEEMKQRKQDRFERIRNIMKDKLNTSSFLHDYEKLKVMVWNENAMECYLDYYSIDYEKFINKWWIISENWKFYFLK